MRSRRTKSGLAARSRRPHAAGGVGMCRMPLGEAPILERLRCMPRGSDETPPHLGCPVLQCDGQDRSRDARGRRCAGGEAYGCLLPTRRALFHGGELIGFGPSQQASLFSRMTEFARQAAARAVDEGALRVGQVAAMARRVALELASALHPAVPRQRLATAWAKLESLVAPAWAPPARPFEEVNAAGADLFPTTRALTAERRLAEGRGESSSLTQRGPLPYGLTLILGLVRRVAWTMPADRRFRAGGTARPILAEIDRRARSSANLKLAMLALDPDVPWSVEDRIDA